MTIESAVILALLPLAVQLASDVVSLQRAAAAARVRNEREARHD